MCKAHVEGNWSCISKYVHYLVQFGQMSGHDSEVGGRLSYILDSLYEESIDHLTCNDMFRTFAC